MKITTREELLNHIAAHKGRAVPLFSAYGEHGIVGDDTIKPHLKISIRPTTHSVTDFLFICDDWLHSLGDRHLDGVNAYNDNWWFTTREEAEAYVEERRKDDDKQD